MRIGASIGPYLVTRELGRGGMGAVVAARDTRTGSEVAIKLLAGVGVGQKLRFLQEAQALARVRDPGLVEILEVDFSGPIPYLVMRLLEGESLQDRLRLGPFPVELALSTALELGRTLQRLHAAGVVHRDIKPANVILRTDGSVVLLDLGLALLLDRGQRLTHTGNLLGTPGYMAPEQARGEVWAMGPATDVWGLGALLFALLTGRPPLAETTGMPAEPPAPLSTRVPGIDPRLDRLVSKCLAWGAADRPNLPNLLLELQRLRPAPKGPDRRRTWLVRAIVCLSCIGAGLMWLAVIIGPVATVASGQARPGDLEPGGETSKALVDSGVQRLAQGDLAGARADLDRAVELDPGSAAAYGDRAVVRRFQGDVEGARSDCDRALELDPRLVAALCNRAVLRRLKGDLLGARADYDRAVELDPGDPLSRSARADVRFAQGDLAGALSDYDRALELDANSPGVHVNRGILHHQRGDFAAARNDYDRAIELDSRCAKAFDNRGSLRGAEGDFAAALSDHERAVALDPRDARAHRNRGRARHELGDLSGAEADFDRALELDPAYGLPHANRGLLRAERGDLDGAAADLERFLLLSPDDPRVELARAELVRIRAQLDRPR